MEFRVQRIQQEMRDRDLPDDLEELVMNVSIRESLHPRAFAHASMYSCCAWILLSGASTRPSRRSRYSTTRACFPTLTYTAVTYFDYIGTGRMSRTRCRPLSQHSESWRRMRTGGRSPRRRSTGRTKRPWTSSRSCVHSGCLLPSTTRTT